MLDAVCMPWLVDSAPSARGLVMDAAEQLLTGRATVVYPGAVATYFDPERLFDVLPGCVLPLPAMWVEHRLSNVGPLIVGMLMEANESPSMLQMLSDGQVGTWSSAVATLRAFNHTDAPLCTSIECYLFEIGRQIAVGPVLSLLLVADPLNGLSPAKHPDNPEALLIASKWHGAPGLGEAVAAALSRVAIRVAFNCMAFMNAHNIELVDDGRTNDDVPRRRREAERLPWVRRKVLKLRRGGELVDPIPHDGVGSRPMHIVRGHFKQYGADGRGLLFGRYRRYIWCPPHMRGDATFGVVVKDYELCDAEAAGRIDPPTQAEHHHGD